MDVAALQPGEVFGLSAAECPSAMGEGEPEDGGPSFIEGGHVPCGCGGGLRNVPSFCPTLGQGSLA